MILLLLLRPSILKSLPSGLNSPRDGGLLLPSEVAASSSVRAAAGHGTIAPDAGISSDLNCCEFHS